MAAAKGRKFTPDDERNALLESGMYEIVPGLDIVMAYEGNEFRADFYDFRIYGKRNPVQLFWLGYVGVPKTSWLWGTHYDGIYSDLPKNYPEVCVHGGLTFADEGRDVFFPDYWYYGFDCAHGFDLMPLQLKAYTGLAAASKYFRPKYRTKQYVLNECLRLATQLKRIESIRSSHRARAYLKPRTQYAKRNS